MKKLRYILIILLLSSCMNTLKSKEFGIYGISDIKKKREGDIEKVFFHIHFSNNIDRYSVHYHIIIKGEWVRAGVYDDYVPEDQKRKAQRSVGVPMMLERDPGQRVKIKVWAYLPVMYQEPAVFDYTFR